MPDPYPVMLSAQSTPSAAYPPRPQRVLACVLCQQRKVKCDRKFPCANCTKHGAQCVPATQLPRRRRRRFPERELLDQLGKYENLLRENKISFEPIQKESRNTKDSPDMEEDSDEEQQRGGMDEVSPATTVKSDRVPEVKNFWHAVRQRFGDPNASDSSREDSDEAAINHARDNSFLDDGHFIFGSSPLSAMVDLSTLHPEPIQIFRLWQLYLDNVNPLLKIVHAPTMQARVIEVVSNITTISPVFEALMFGIYTMAVQSLAADECLAMLGASKKELLVKYQFSCQKALLNCGFLRCTDRECLVALYLYMVSVSTTTDARALCSISGLAIRIAQRMKIDSETDCAKCGVLEGEMRRRLWWSLVFFDTRIGQLAEFKCQALIPTWDCAVPLNVNDADLRPEMKSPPKVHNSPTEAIFVVVRGILGEFIRNSMFHLNFVAPHLTPIARNVQCGPTPEGGELIKLEKMVEEEYLQFCDPENPLHFMTIWKVRGHIASFRFLENYSKSLSSDQDQSQAQLEAAVSLAHRILECDTKLMTSPLTKGFRWLEHYHFPFPAYIHLVKDLRRRPQNDIEAWERMSENFEARFDQPRKERTPFFRVFAKLILQGWKSREEEFAKSGEIVVPPRIVLQLRDAMSAQGQQGVGTEQPLQGTDIGMGNYSTIPMDVGQSTLPPIIDSESYGGPWADYITGQPSLDLGMNGLDWTGMSWGTGQNPPW